MGNRLFVGNLSWEATEDGLRSFLGDSVTGAKIITDRETGRSRGFAFVEAESDDAAADIISGFDGKLFLGRDLRINEAHERAPRSSGGGGGYSSDRGGGGGDSPPDDGRRGRRGKRRRSRDNDFDGDRY